MPIQLVLRWRVRDRMKRSLALKLEFVVFSRMSFAEAVSQLLLPLEYDC